MSDPMLSFLRAQFDDDERVATAAIRQHERAVAEFKAGRPADIEALPGETAADWDGGSDESGDGHFRQEVWAGEGMVTIAEMLDEQDWASPVHIARWDPARVLAEMESKREILKLHEPRTITVADYEQFAAGVVACSTCSYPHGPAVGADEYQPYPCPTVRALLIPYRDRPGYDSAWSPDG